MNKANCKYLCTDEADCDHSCESAVPVRVRSLLEGKRMPPGLPASLVAPATPSTKDTNPKDSIGSAKLPLHLVPDTLEAFAAVAFAEGASKYGAYNWRAAGARASVYVSALRRHLAKWWNGEDVDPVTQVPHLASVAACVAVLIDVSVADTLVDDRPPRLNALPPWIDGKGVELVAHVRRINQHHNPHHHTIQDEARDAAE